MATPSKMALAAAGRRRLMPGSDPSPAAISQSLMRPAEQQTITPPSPPNPTSVAFRQTQVAQPRNPTIYQELMRKHDRMTQRHLPRT